MPTTNPVARPSAARAQRGVTLIEACAVLAVIGVVASSAVPAFGDVMERRVLEGRATELATDLQGLRADAVARNRTLRISFGSDAGGSCYVVHTGNANACTCTSDGPAQCTAGTDAVKSVFLPASGPVRLEANVGSMVYDPSHGTTTVGSTLRLIDSKGRSIRHVVNIMGRVRTCSPQGEVRGYKAC